MANWENCPAAERSEKLGGTWVFKGTRLPLYVLYDNLAAGMTADQFSKWHRVDKWKVEAVLKHEADTIEEDRLVDTATGNETRTPRTQRPMLKRIILWVTACVIPAAVLLAVVVLADALWGSENTFHAALIAMCAAAILMVQPFSGAIPWVQKSAPTLAATFALVSGYLWAANDAGAEPTNLTFLGILGWLAVICLIMAITLSIPFWHTSNTAGKDQRV